MDVIHHHQKNKLDSIYIINQPAPERGQPKQGGTKMEKQIKLTHYGYSNGQKYTEDSYHATAEDAQAEFLKSCAENVVAHAITPNENAPNYCWDVHYDSYTVLSKHDPNQTERLRKLLSYDPVKSAAAALGRKGGSSKSEAKRKASAENGKKGGRPFRYMLVKKINGRVVSRHFTMDAATKAWNKWVDAGKGDIDPLEKRAYSETYWRDMK